MKLLEDRILKDGQVRAGNILKVDNFLNHQIDAQLLDEIGREFVRLYKDEGITKVLTIVIIRMERHIAAPASCLTD